MRMTFPYRMGSRSGAFIFGTALAATLFCDSGALKAQVPSRQTEPTEETWFSIKDNIFGGAKLENGSALLVLETPARAEDAAIVPVTIRATLPEGDSRAVRRFTLIVDENPAPLAGVFEIGLSSGVTAITTRVRVNSYTYIRAAAELSDGRIYMVKNFVKASGGCSAPALKDSDQALANIGVIKLKQFKAGGPGNSLAKVQEAQIMIRHPNYSGLQMDQITRLYIPANFVEELRIWQGGDLILAMTGAISISENPNIRFNYIPNGASHFRAEARDSKGQIFKTEWAVETGAM
jgi:sulfur-oxidizing protein SoxY